MRKLFQIKCVGTHGGAGMAEYVGQTAISQGWDSYIAYARIRLPTKSHFIRIGKKWDIYEHVLETRLFDNHGFASRCATKKLVKQIEEIKPDIIHLHNLHGYYLNIQILFDYLGEVNIPIVWTMHDCWMFTGHCSHFVGKACYKWKDHCGECPAYKEYPASWFIDKSSANFEKKKTLFNKPKRMVLVPVSKWIADFLPESFMAKYPTKLIYNGVDVDVFKPVTKEKQEELKTKFNIKGKFVILGVAHTWSDSKGLSDFIELSKLIDENYALIMIGLSQEQIKHLPRNIIGITRTSNIEQMVGVYSMADAFWNPTYIDTFPTTNLEALACGTPCVVYRTGGSPEAVDENTGYVVGQGDVKGSLLAFQNIKEKGKNYYSVSCRRRAETYYNKNTQFNEYIKLYETLLKD